MRYSSVMVPACVGIVFGSFLDIFLHLQVANDEIFLCQRVPSINVMVCLDENCFGLLGSFVDISLRLTVKISCSNFGHLWK